MKYIAWSGVVLALIGIVQAFFLGVSYHFEGYGLHPLIAAAVSLILALGGWWLAGWAERLEADELNQLESEA